MKDVYNRKIDCSWAKQVFQKYTDAYDSKDEKIKLKIDHTYRVAELCRQIALAENLSEDRVEFAWMLGLLHDVGRFEQIRRYGTFLDEKSIDHAALSADILFLNGKINDYLVKYTEEARKETVLHEEDLELMEAAIRYHSAYRLPEELAPSTAYFCNLLRDADKIDILKVNVDVPLEAIYNVTTEELKQCTVSDEVLKSFSKEHATLKSLKKTPIDHVVGHISLIYELVFSISVEIVETQGYLNKLLNYTSDNPKTQKQLKWIREQVADYMKRRSLDTL